MRYDALRAAISHARGPFDGAAGASLGIAAPHDNAAHPLVAAARFEDARGARPAILALDPGIELERTAERADVNEVRVRLVACFARRRTRAAEVRNRRQEVEGSAAITKIEAARYPRSVFASRDQLIGDDIGRGARIGNVGANARWKRPGRGVECPRDARPEEESVLDGDDTDLSGKRHRVGKDAPSRVRENAVAHRFEAVDNRIERETWRDRQRHCRSDRNESEQARGAGAAPWQSGRNRRSGAVCSHDPLRGDS